MSSKDEERICTNASTGSPRIPDADFAELKAMLASATQEMGVGVLLAEWKDAERNDFSLHARFIGTIDMQLAAAFSLIEGVVKYQPEYGMVLSLMSGLLDVGSPEDEALECIGEPKGRA